jgi:hypothetical protein
LDCRDVRFGSFADIAAALANVCFTPESGHPRRPLSCPARTLRPWTSKTAIIRFNALGGLLRLNTEVTTIRADHVVGVILVLEHRGVVQFPGGVRALMCSSHNQYSPAKPTMPDATTIQVFQLAAMK